jgi:uncharacterized protein (TIGR03437 family)
MPNTHCSKASLIILLCGLLGHGTVSAAPGAGPVLSYATFLGGGTGGTYTSVGAATTDSQGNVFITGSTDGGVPTTPGSYHPQFIGGACYGAGQTFPCTDVFVAKFSAGGQLIWSTYVGGSQSESGRAIAVDAAGNVFIAGTTNSTDFPVTANALQKTGPVEPAEAPAAGFLVELDAAGAHLLYGTYLGASPDSPTSLAYGASGNLYVAGYAESGAFPLLHALQPNSGGGDCSNAFQKLTCGDAFIMRWRTSDMTLLASTLFGGSGDDSAGALTLDQSGNVYLTGSTSSANFPLKNPLQSTVGGGVCQSVDGQVSTRCPDAFVTKLSADLSSVLYSTRLGGDGADSGSGIAVDAQGNIVIAGTTQSTDFPTANAIQPSLAMGTCYRISALGVGVPCSDGFVAKLAPDGASLVYSTYLGGSSDDTVYGLALDAAGNADVVGATESTDFPVTPNAVQHCNGTSLGTSGGTGFATALTSGGQIAWSTYLGGSGFDVVQTAAAGQGQLFLGGITASPNFPVTAGAIQPKFFPGNGIGFLAILDLTRSYSAPYVEPACVLNAASYLSGPIAPGEIISIFGQVLGPAGGAGPALDAQGRIAESLAGVSATFDGTAAPLLWAGPNQINAIAPFGLAGKTSTQLVVSYLGAPSPPTTLAVGTAAPGVFTYAGKTQAVAYNQDGTLNGPSNPAARGSTMAIWMTGAGPLSQSYADGQIVVGTAETLAALVSPPQLDFGSLNYDAPQAVIVYAGQAPGLVAGAVQVNFTVPLGAPSGAAVPVYLTVSGMASELEGLSVTLAVQ